MDGAYGICDRGEDVNRDSESIHQCPASTINEILNERRSITPEMALRLGHALGTSPGYWMNLQLAVSLYDAEHSPAKAEVERLPILVSREAQGA
jgi:plasmid maintenance system antidote protein VapI